MHGLPVQEFSSTGSDFPWFLSLSHYFTETAHHLHACIHARIQMYARTHKMLLHNNEDNVRHDLATV